MLYEINGQRKPGSDGVITIEELKNFIRQRVPYLVQTTKVNPPTGQNRARQEGKLIFLEPGETREYHLDLEILTRAEAIQDFLAQAG